MAEHFLQPRPYGLMQRLPDVLRQRLESAGRIKRFDDGQTIHLKGDRHAGLSIVRRGEVRIQTIGRGGDRSITTTLRAGDSFGEFTVLADLPRSHDAEAAGATELIQISRREFRALMDELPGLRDHMLENLSQMLFSALSIIEDERRLPVPALVARTLIELAIETDGTIAVPHTQSAIAEHVAATRVSVGKALGDLQRLGLIETAYGRVVIRHIKGLRRVVAASREAL